MTPKLERSEHDKMIRDIMVRIDELFHNHYMHTFAPYRERHLKRAKSELNKVLESAF
jgi:hypothetical protein